MGKLGYVLIARQVKVTSSRVGDSGLGPLGMGLMLFGLTFFFCFFLMGHNISVVFFKF